MRAYDEWNCSKPCHFDVKLSCPEKSILDAKLFNLLGEFIVSRGLIEDVK